MIQNATIRFKLRLLKPPVKGREIEIKMDLDDLEEDRVSTQIMEEGHYTSMGFPYDYYQVLEREITLH